MKHFLCKQLIRARVLITALYTLLAISGYTQVIEGSFKLNLPPDTSQNRPPDTAKLPPAFVQALPPDTAKTGFALDSEVKYKASDSMRLEPKKQLIYLYGKAEVKYETQTLTAHYMEISMLTNEVLAVGKTDSTGKLIEKVKFTDGENELDASKVRFNMQTKKGKVYDVWTQEGEAYIHMGEAKKQPNDEVHLRNGKFTTCSNEKPHYHFRMRRAIVIPDDKIITGPVYMVVGKVPTPLALPFGYFPNKKGKVHGIIIPQYGASQTFGYFLQNGGYYIPIGQKADMQFTGDIYSRGSWALKQLTRYKVRYRYNGNMNMSFSQFKQGDKDFPDFSKSNEFFVRWMHNQDPKARPGSRFTANVNFGTQTNFQNNFNTYTQDYLASSFQSNMSYTRTWIGTPLSLTTSLRHNQNRLSKIITVTAPELTFNVARFFPLARKEAVGSKKWYENIGVSFLSNARNDISAGDSLFSLNNVSTLLNKYSRNGVKHDAVVGTTFKLFGQRVTFNPNATMSERWYSQTLNQNYINSMVVSDTINKFSRSFEYAFNGSLTTRIFGMYASRKPNGAKLRHILTPSLNFQYRPGFKTTNTVQVDSIGNTRVYSPYELGVFGYASPYESGTVGLSLVNSLELKKRSAKDTVTGFVKIPIIENFQANANYDLVKDSLNLSPIQFSARNTFFNVLGVVYSSVLDPYYYEQGRITRNYYWQKGKGLGRITSNNLAVSYTYKAKPRKPKPQKTNLTEEEKDEQDALKRNTAGYVDFDVPLTLSTAYNLNFNRQYFGALDTVIMTQSINLTGDVSITKKLKIGFNTNYDFVSKKVTYTEFNIYYDLHCWEFAVNVIPFGLRKSYLITLNVKASILQDLRLQRRGSWVDLNNRVEP